MNTILSRPGLGSVLTFRQYGEPITHRVRIDRPTLVQVTRGKKVLRGLPTLDEITPGQMVAIAGGTIIDIEHRLDEAGVYEARVLELDEALISHWFERCSHLPVIAGIWPLRSQTDGFRSSFDVVCDAIADPGILPLRIAEARAQELLAWVAEAGGRFVPVTDPSESARVKTLVNRDLGRRWTAVEVSGALGMSEATLHRHLAHEGNSFSELLRELRLSRALTLILATNRPIDAVAGDVGYEDASHFSRRFRERFGHNPSLLRGKQVQNELKPA